MLYFTTLPSSTALPLASQGREDVVHRLHGADLDQRCLDGLNYGMLALHLCDALDLPVSAWSELRAYLDDHRPVWKRREEAAAVAQAAAQAATQAAAQAAIYGAWGAWGRAVNTAAHSGWGACCGAGCGTGCG